MNYTDLQQVDLVTRHVHCSHARQRHDLIGCSETRTTGAQSVRMLWTLPLEYTCWELDFSSVQFMWCEEWTGLEMIVQEWSVLRSSCTTSPWTLFTTAPPCRGSAVPRSAVPWRSTSPCRGPPCRSAVRGSNSRTHRCRHYVQSAQTGSSPSLPPAARRASCRWRLHPLVPHWSLLLGGVAATATGRLPPDTRLQSGHLPPEKYHRVRLPLVRVKG